MKRWIVFVGLALGLNAQGQTSTEFLFTNKVATFTNLQGLKYTGAELIRASSKEVIFKTNGDYGTVSFTNLSPATLQEIGVPAEFLQKARDLEKRRVEAVVRDKALFSAEQKQLAEGTNLVLMKVDGVIGRPEFNATYGYLQKCTVQLPGGKFGLYVSRLPERIPTYLGQTQALEKLIAEMTAKVATGNEEIANRNSQLNQRQWQINRAAAVPPVTTYWLLTNSPVYYYYYDYYSQRTAVNLAQADLDYSRATLEEMKTYLSGLESQLSDLQGKLTAVKENELAGTSVQVLVSRFLHNGSRIAVCAPENLQTVNTGAQEAR